MQIWHDQQYFTDDLRMKRVHIDHDWMTVAEIKRRALGDRIFLSALNDVLSPPGLSRQPDIPSPFVQSNVFQRNNLEPVSNLATQQSSQSPSMDQYLNGISTRSDSPSSLSTGGFSRQSFPINGSGFGSRAVSSDIAFSGRSGSFPRSDSPAASLIARRTFNDSPDSALGRGTDFQQSRLPVFDSPVMSASNSVSGHNYQPILSLGNIGYRGNHTESSIMFDQTGGPAELPPSSTGNVISHSFGSTSVANSSREFSRVLRNDSSLQPNSGEINGGHQKFLWTHKLIRP